MARGKFKSRCHDGAELRQARLPGIDDGPQEGEEEVVVGLLQAGKAAKRPTTAGVTQLDVFEDISSCCCGDKSRCF